MLTDDPMQFDRLTEERPAALKPGASAVGAASERALPSARIADVKKAMVR